MILLHNQLSSLLQKGLTMEIERKYLVAKLPDRYETYPSSLIRQGYLNTAPVVRVRKDGEEYYLTYKGKGLMAREEYNLPLTKEAYGHLIQKADGIILSKRRYRIPLWEVCAPSQKEKARGLTVELDIFEGDYKGLVLAEVEFPGIEEAEAFIPPDWFGKDVTFSGEYQNSRLALAKREDFPR